MNIIEPLFLQRIDKDVSPNGMDYSNRKILNPIRDVLNTRYLSSEDGNVFTGENIKGTTKINFSLPAGLNECIGIYENLSKNILIYFLWNSDGRHSVCKYEANADLITTIIVDDPALPCLSFSNNPRYCITGIGMIEDILSWTDNLNPQRYINITRTYASMHDFNVSLMKIGPRIKPDIHDKASNSTLGINKTADLSFQFAYRYIYLDNEISVMSPYSDLLRGNAYGSDYTFTTKLNSANVHFAIDTDVAPYLKRIELMVRQNNDPNWKVIAEITNFSGTIVYTFKNETAGKTVSTGEVTKIFDSVPNKSKALTIFKNRIFLNINEEGFNLTPMTLTAALSNSFNSLSETNNRFDPDNGVYFKKNGEYSVGIVACDKFGRYSGVYAKTLFTGKDWLWTERDLGYKLNVTLAGLFPVGSRYSIVLSEESKYEKYFQSYAPVQLYKRENNPDGEPFDSATEELIGSHVYRARFAVENFSGAFGHFNYVHIYLPEDVPFVPDNSFLVRILYATDVINDPPPSSTINLSKVTEKVLDIIDSNVLVSGNFEKTDWTGVRRLMVEVFKLKNVSDIFYYEVAGPFSTVGDLPITPFVNNIKGDTYIRGGFQKLGGGFPFPLFYDNNYRLSSSYFNGGDPLTVGLGESIPGVQIETPAPIYKVGNQLATSTLSMLPKHVAYDVKSSAKSYASDYDKIAWSKGRSFVESPSQVLQRPATIRFSDVYVESSNINGLNSFQFDSVYDKVGQDRSAITKLIPVGRNLLAIHERNITTLYIGEGILTAGAQSILTKQEGVVGDDNKLVGEFGSYHPESIQEIDGQVFGFDIFSGAVWRYTVEGLYAVSKNGMTSFFRNKARAYLPYRDELKFVSGVDRFHTEYLLTLPNKWTTFASPVTMTIPGSSASYDFILNPATYTLGETYRILLMPVATSETGDTITISVKADGTTDMCPEIHNKLKTLIAADADQLKIEFIYTGQSFIRIAVSNVSHGANVGISAQFAEIKGETWSYNYEAKQWELRYSYVAEFIGKVGTTLLSFKNGELYKHNSSNTYNNFYGVQYPRRIEADINPQPNKEHTWSAVHVNGEICADPTSGFKVFEAYNDEGQATYVRAKEFDKKESTYEASILKDINTNPALIPAGKIALRDGKDMRSRSLKIVINNDRSDISILQKINILSEYSEFSA